MATGDGDEGGSCEAGGGRGEQNIAYRLHDSDSHQVNLEVDVVSKYVERSVAGLKDRIDALEVHWRSGPPPLSRVGKRV